MTCQTLKIISIDANFKTPAMRKHNFREDTKQLFDATVVTYAGLYTTKNTTLKALKTSKPSLPALEPYFSAVWPYLPKFRKSLLNQFKEIVVLTIVPRRANLA